MRKPHRCLSLCSALVSACGAALAQTTPLIDIHPSAAELRTSLHMTRKVGPVLSSGLLQMRNATMLDLIVSAYGIDAAKVTGGPRWLNWDRFDINAALPADSTAESQKAFLRKMLTDRFGLALHAGAQPVNTWVLGAGKTNKLVRDQTGSGTCQIDRNSSVAAARTGDPDKPLSAPLNTFNCTGVGMSAFAAQLATLASSYLQNIPVVDQTNLSGGWTFKLTLTPNSDAAGWLGGISLETALKQLGLDLTQKPRSSEVLVIDSVNENPTPNSREVTRALATRLPGQFDVASVRQGTPAPSTGPVPLNFSLKVTPGGGLNYRNIAFSTLVDQAFVGEIGGPILSPGRIIGVPPTLLSSKYDIEAKPPRQSAAGSVPGPIDSEDAYRMLKQLLIDRFEIKFHTESRQLDGFALSVATPGKIKAANPNEKTGFTMVNGTGTAGRKVILEAVSMPELAEVLRLLAPGETDGLPIQDGTGLDGRYDLTLDFNPLAGINPAGATDSALAAQLTEGRGLTEALRGQGLSLRKTKVPMKVLVVDHVNLTPKDN